MKCPDDAISFSFEPDVGARTSYGGSGSIVHRSKLHSFNLHVGRYIFNCCGAFEISHMYEQLTQEYDSRGYPKVTPGPAWIKAKQDFLCAYLRSQGQGRTGYFIITGNQIKSYGGEGSAYALMMEMGAKLVDDTPNQIHGPEKMMLHVWAPNLNLELLKKYVDVDLQGNWNPIWWNELTEAGQAELLVKYPVLTQQQLYEQDVARAKKIREDQEKEQKRQLQNIAYYHPDWLKECGYRQVTPEQEAMLDQKSNQVSTLSAAAIQQSLKGSKASTWAF